MELQEKVQPAHTALLVIDIQKDFASPEGMLAKKGRDLSLVEPMLEKLVKTIAAAEKAGVPVLYTQQVYDRSHLNELQKEQYDLDGKDITCDINTDGYTFYKIKPAPEHVFVKYDFNAFSNPTLEKTLQDKGIKTIIITGMDTQWCVETAIRTACDRGYKVVVPEDLVACNAKHLDQQLRTLALVRRSFGVVTTSEDIIKIWESNS